MEHWRWRATWRGQNPSTRERSLHATWPSGGTGAISKWSNKMMTRTWTWTWPGSYSDQRGAPHDPRGRGDRRPVELPLHRRPPPGAASGWKPPSQWLAEGADGWQKAEPTPIGPGHKTQSMADTQHRPGSSSALRARTSRSTRACQATPHIRSTLQTGSTHTTRHPRGGMGATTHRSPHLLELMCDAMRATVPLASLLSSLLLLRAGLRIFPAIRRDS